MAIRIAIVMQCDAKMWTRNSRGYSTIQQPLLLVTLVLLAKKELH